MRIVSIVELFSPDGAYGGPTRVALNQAAELIRNGHEVVVLGGQRGYGAEPPTTMHGVPVKLFPVRRLVPGTAYAGLISPGLSRWLAVNRHRFDLIHIHMSRDLVTMRAAMWARRHGIPYVVQTHGMIDPSRRLLAVPLDRLWTRSALADARAVFYLTSHERTLLEQVARRPLAYRRLVNGVPAPDEVPELPPDREVLYLARVASRKRPEFVVAAAERLSAAHPDVRFRIVGPAEDIGDELTARIAGARGVDVVWEGALDPAETDARMTRSSIYVLPSVDEPYPMSVLEAMALGRPVIVTESCGLAPVVAETECGIVAGTDLDSFVSAVDRLLSDEGLGRRMGARGAHVARERFSMTAIAQELDLAYAQALAGPVASFGRSSR